MVLIGDYVGPGKATRYAEHEGMLAVLKSHRLVLYSRNSRSDAVAYRATQSADLCVYIIRGDPH
jgi:hypothetical protein